MMNDEREMRRLYEADPDNIVYQALVKLYQLRRVSLYNDYKIPEAAAENLRFFFARNHIAHLSGILILFAKQNGSFIVTFKSDSASLLFVIDSTQKMYFHFKKFDCFYAIKGECKIDAYLPNEMQKFLWEHEHKENKRLKDVKEQCVKMLDKITPNHGLQMIILKDNKH